MKISELLPQQAEIFSSLDPYGMTRLSACPAVHALLATEETGRGNSPVGLCVVSLEKDSADILWFFIRENSREKGYGDELLYRTIKLVNERGKQKVRVRMPYLSRGAGLPVSLEYFFSQRTFTRDGTITNEWVLDSDRTQDLVPEDYDEKDKEGVKAFAELTRSEKTQAFDLLKEKKGYGPIFGVKIGSDIIDEEASCVCYDNDMKPVGILLFVCTEGVWTLAGHYTETDDAAKRIISFSVERITRSMRGKEELWLLDVNRILYNAISKMLPKVAAGGSFYLVSDEEV